MKLIADLLLRLFLISLLIASLTACAGQRIETPVPCPKPPPYPVAGPKVATELRQHCFPKTSDTHETIMLCPATAEWLARIDKLRDQLAP